MSKRAAGKPNGCGKIAEIAWSTRKLRITTIWFRDNASTVAKYKGNEKCRYECMSVQKQTEAMK